MARKDNVVNFPTIEQEANPVRRLVPGRLQEARHAARFNQTELANLVGVSRQAISSYEQGEKNPDPESMRLIAGALNQPISYFTRAGSSNFGKLTVNFFRKVGADTKRRNLACEVFANWLSQTAFVFDPVANFPHVNLPSYAPASNSSNQYEDEEIEEKAEELRDYFGLGLGPISNVVRLMESKGIIICRAQIENESIEAFSFWSGSRPFVFLASNKDSGARARFDAAHELAHLVLHRWVNSDEIEDKDRLKVIESEADRFAGAFLLPRKSFPNEVYTPRLLAFVDLKGRWKVSIQAMIYRCKKLGIFDDQQITNLYKQVSFKGWRKIEPLDGPDGIPLEQPILLKKIAQLVLEKGIRKRDEILSILGFSPSMIEQLTGLPSGYLSQEQNADFEPTLKGTF
jgi:Zn-dependent peptidase ImmA (M78 family)/DNA-binding XRE family transcriptional regulator